MPVYDQTPALACLPRPALSWLGLIALAAVALACSGHPGSRARPASWIREERPKLIINDFRLEVTQQGRLRQSVQAERGEMDEIRQTIDLDRLECRFFRAGQMKGSASCGRGRVWLADLPSKNVSKNDILLRHNVLYRTVDGWAFSTPRLRYVDREALLHSDAGYRQQIKLRNGYLVGRGERFEVKLLLKESTFESWRCYGDPVVLKFSKEPVIEL